MGRGDLTDREWGVIGPLLPPEAVRLERTPVRSPPNAVVHVASWERRLRLGVRHHEQDERAAALGGSFGMLNVRNSGGSAIVAWP